MTGLVAEAGGEVAPTTDGPFAGFMGADGAFKQGHADSLPEGLKEYAPTLAGYGKFEDVLKDLHVFKTKGDTGIKVPGEGADAATVAAFRKAIGAGEKAEDYGLKEDAKAIAEWALAHNLPKSAVAKLMEMRNAESESAKAKAAEADASRKAELLSGLNKMWGANMESEAQKAEAVAALFNITPQEIASLPAELALKVAGAFNKLNPYFSESDSMRSKLGTPGAANESNNPAAVIQQVTTGQHPRSEAWRKGDPATIAWMNSLYKAKYAAIGIR